MFLEVQENLNLASGSSKLLLQLTFSLTKCHMLEAIVGNRMKEKNTQLCTFALLLPFSNYFLLTQKKKRNEFYDRVKKRQLPRNRMYCIISVVVELHSQRTGFVF